MPRKVQVNTGFTNVALPTGLSYNAGDTVVLTDEQASKLLDTIFTQNVLASDSVSRPVLIDLGAYGTVYQTGTQTARTAPAALTGQTPVATTAPTTTTPYGYTTSAQATAIYTQINAIQVDVAALRAEIVAITNALIAAAILTGTVVS